MRWIRFDVIAGCALSAAVALLFTAASRAGMPTTGLHGGIEHVAALFFLVTLPAGALAALCGHLALRVGPGAAFTVTGVAWVLLSFPVQELCLTKSPSTSTGGIAPFARNSYELTQRTP